MWYCCILGLEPKAFTEYLDGCKYLRKYYPEAKKADTEFYLNTNGAILYESQNKLIAVIYHVKESIKEG